MFPKQGPAQISWFFSHDRYPMGLIQSLGFFDIFITSASWFMKIFKFKELVWLPQRTGKELAVKGRFFDLIVIFVSFLFVNACNRYVVWRHIFSQNWTRLHSLICELVTNHQSKKRIGVKWPEWRLFVKSWRRIFKNKGTHFEHLRLPIPHLDNGNHVNCFFMSSCFSHECHVSKTHGSKPWV